MVRMNESMPTALVSFKSHDDAFLIGQMIEAHYMKQKEWPDTQGQLVLPLPQADDLMFLFLQKWDYEDLKMTCTKNFLNLVSIDDVANTKRGFSFDGQILSFQAPTAFYVERLNDMYENY